MDITRNIEQVDGDEEVIEEIVVDENDVMVSSGVGAKEP